MVALETGAEVRSIDAKASLQPRRPHEVRVLVRCLSQDVVEVLVVPEPGRSSSRRALKVQGANGSTLRRMVVLQIAELYDEQANALAPPQPPAPPPTPKPHDAAALKPEPSAPPDQEEAPSTSWRLVAAALGNLQGRDLDGPQAGASLGLLGRGDSGFGLSADLSWAQGSSTIADLGALGHTMLSAAAGAQLESDPLGPISMAALAHWRLGAVHYSGQAERDSGFGNESSWLPWSGPELGAHLHWAFSARWGITLGVTAGWALIGAEALAEPERVVAELGGPWGSARLGLSWRLR